MSVNCIIHAASDEEITLLRREPTRIHRFLNPPRANQPSWFRRLLRPEAPAVPPSRRSALDIGKSSEAIHFVLTGTTEDRRLPAGFLVKGGRWIGDEDVGFGPARALYSCMVRDVAAFLAPISIGQFREKCDPGAFAAHDIYGAPLPGDTLSLNGLVQDFADLRQFIQDRATAGDGVVIQYV